MKYYFIINPNAGSKHAPETMTPIVKEFQKKYGADCEILITMYQGHAEILTREICEKGEPVRICACGGDGTLNEVAKGALGFDNAELCFCPCGSGNDFIKTFGNPDDFRSIDYIYDVPSRKIDIIKANNRICINIVSVGLDADITKRSYDFRKVPFVKGKTSYDLATVFSLPSATGKCFTFEYGGKVMDEKITLAVVGNGKVYGGGFHATPYARPDDGMLDVIIIKKLPFAKLAGTVSLFKRGEHVNENSVNPLLKDTIIYERMESLKISSDKEFFINVDGEIECSNRLNLEIIKGAISFVTPYDK